MRYVNKQAITIVALLVLLVAGSGYYYFRLVTTDSPYIVNNSMEYYLLVPTVLKQLPLDSMDQVMRYSYTAADADKPAVVSVEFVTHLFAGTAYEKMVNYFDGLGFDHTQGDLSQGNIKVLITHTGSELGAVLMKVEILER